MSNKLVDRVLKLSSIHDILNMFGEDIVPHLSKKYPEIKSHLDKLSKGSFTFRTDPPYKKNVKFNIKIVDYTIDIEEDMFIDVSIYVDLLLPNNLSPEEKQFISEWVTSYTQEDPKDIESLDTYFNDKSLWVYVIRVNGVRVEMPRIDNVNPPSDERAFDILKIPYSNEDNN
jgi:hypothetical protein